MYKIIYILLIIIFFSNNIFAQGCAMCGKTASQLGDDAGNSLNAGIIYLAFLPLAIILFLLVKWYRAYKHTI